MPWDRHLGGTLPGPAGGGCTLPGPAGGRGVPCQVQPRGYPARSSWGGTLPGPAGGVPGRVPPCQGTPLARSGQGGYPARSSQEGGYQVGYPPPPARSGQVGYPARTTWGVLATWRAVCLLRSRRRTFLFNFCLRLSLSLILCLSCWIQSDANFTVSNATISKMLTSDCIQNAICVHFGYSRMLTFWTQLHFGYSQMLTFWIQLRWNPTTQTEAQTQRSMNGMCVQRKTIHTE